MADVKIKWIKIYTNMVSNKKIRRIRTLPEGNSIILIWVFLIAQAGESNKNGALYLTDTIPFTPEDLAIEFDFELSIIKFALITLEKYSMVEVFDDVIYIKNWDEYQNVEGLEKIRIQNRDRKRIERAGKKLLLEEGKESRDSHVTVTQSHATEIDKDLEIERESITVFFESVWKLYPKKEGKGQVSKSQKEKLHKIGLDEITRSINRFIQTKKGVDKQYLQNGSTFFNGGYVDYLDANYQEDKPKGRIGVTEGEGAGERRPDM